MFRKDCIVLHAPHTSLFIPEDERRVFVLNDKELKSELLTMTDHFVDELFYYPGVDMIRSEVSRLVVDMESFRDDEDEIMASVGMGAVYINTSSGKQLRRPNSETRESLLAKYYDPYHRNFAELVEQKLNQHDRCLILDCHSFPAAPLPYEFDQNPKRPDFCIGTCDFHTPPELLEYTVHFFTGHNLKIALNRPFAGTIVPIKHYLVDKRVASLMIEVNRGLYVDESTGVKTASFPNIKNLLNEFITGIIKE